MGAKTLPTLCPSALTLVLLACSLFWLFRRATERELSSRVLEAAVEVGLRALGDDGLVFLS